MRTQRNGNYLLKTESMKISMEKKSAFNQLNMEKVKLKAGKKFKILKKCPQWKREKKIIVKLPTIELKKIGGNVFK